MGGLAPGMFFVSFFYNGFLFYTNNYLVGLQYEYDNDHNCHQLAKRGGKGMGAHYTPLLGNITGTGKTAVSRSQVTWVQVQFPNSKPEATP